METQLIRIALASFGLAGSAGAATYTVDTAADSGTGSLRWALEQANANPGPDTIEFAAPYSIDLLTDLPPLTDDGTTLDGLSAPGVTLRSAGAGRGLVIDAAADCVVRGLAIRDMPLAGVEVLNGASDNVVAENELVGNSTGLRLFDGASSNDVTGNLVHGCTLDGVEISLGAQHNLLAGNQIFDNGQCGVHLVAVAAPLMNNRLEGNYVGTDSGLAPGLGNGAEGVLLEGSTCSFNYVEGNHVLSNGADGIAVRGAPENLIGPDNVIGGNALNGVYVEAILTEVRENRIGLDGAGVAALPNLLHGVSFRLASGCQVFGNVVSGNLGYGIFLDEASSNGFTGNLIGTDATGLAALGNGAGGIFLAGSDNVFGDFVPGNGNVISGNGGRGLEARSLGGVGSTIIGNELVGNSIGVDADGGPMGNAGAGIWLAEGARAFLIGDPVDPAGGNAIGHNAGPGIRIGEPAANPVPVHHRVLSNRIGANSGEGIRLEAGGNQLLAAPEVTDAEPTAVQGVNTLAGSGFATLVQVFHGPDDEGAVFVGQVFVQSADATWSLSRGDAGWLLSDPIPVGSLVTATNTSAAPVGAGEQTSAFSAPFEIPIARPFCFGDGTGTPCPCGNGGHPGAGCANGTGWGGRLSAGGSISVSAGDLELDGAQLVPGQPGLYFQGDNAINGELGIPFGDGLRCVGMNVVRLEVVDAAGDGSSSTSVDVASTGNALPGDVKYYQLWYRDPQTSTCGSLFNLTNAVEVVWEP